jgi:quercetin dioxygenase-like cupin family protein
MVQSFNSSRMTFNLYTVAMLSSTFLVGLIVGRSLTKAFPVASSSSSSVSTGPKHGSILHLEDIPFRSTSHIDEEGRPIVKQQFLEPFVIPNFVGYSVATFKPGQIMMPPHEHKSLHEFFYVIEGTGIIQKDGVDNEVKPGTFLHMAPLEKHGIWVPKEATQDLKMVVCGVTVGEK